MDKLFASKYWNTNGIGIAIVVVLGNNNDVAAYIGASEEGSQRMEAAFEWAASFGAKLYREEAFGMIPMLEERLQEAGLHYRH